MHNLTRAANLSSACAHSPSDIVATMTACCTGLRCFGSSSLTSSRPSPQNCVQGLRLQGGAIPHRSSSKRQALGISTLQNSRKYKRGIVRRGPRPQASSASDAVPDLPKELNISQRSSFEKFTETLTTLFPVWVCLGAALGISRPSSLLWFKSDLFTYGLGFLMLSMGLTLTLDDFKQCLKNPVPIGVGYLAQYIVKPLLGFLIAKVLNLSPPLAVGLILVSCCPGGQASNVATYIAHGDVALSVLMTTASTLGAIIMTPLLTKTLAGTLVPVDAKGLALSTFQVVLVPTILGVLTNEFFPNIVKMLKPILPLIGVALTTLLCASPCAQVAEILRAQGMNLSIPVALLHVAAFSMGYFICKGIGFNEKTCRTVSIETGMQSAALGFLLAQTHFSDPLVAVPSAVSVVFMALGGSGLAVYWRNKPTLDV